MTRLLVGVAAALIFTASQAAAEGLAPPTSRIRGPEPVGPRWTGFYIGIGIGAGAASYDISGTKTTTSTTTATRLIQGSCRRWTWAGDNCERVCTEYNYHEQSYPVTTTHTDSFGDSGTTDVGAFGVVTVGYDRALRKGWIGGVFADYDFGSGISGGVSLGGVHASLELDSSWAVGGRLGYLVTPSTLLYGTGGYTQAEFNLSGFGSHGFSGYFVGAGVETFLTQNLTLKLEYRFSQFGTETVVDQANLTAELDPSVHSARLVLTYRPE